MLGYLPVIMNFSITRENALKRKTERKKKEYLRELKNDIEYSKSEMNCMMRNFDYVTEPRMVDFYIYRLRAEQSRYAQLMCEYKSLTDSFDNENE